MTITCVSYNIQYGTGMDGRYDIARIAETVADADIIALQEVTRGSPWNGGVDMVAEIRAAFADRFTAVHFPADVDLGSTVAGGVVTEKRFQFGNMVLSRWPLLSVRRHLLPRRLRTAQIDLQRGMIEAMIATPAGTMRVHSVHLDHIDADEQLEQVAALRAILAGFTTRGGAISGLAEVGFPELPLPEDFLVMGDFNFEPGSAAHAAMIEGGTIVDASAVATGATWTDPKGEAPDKRLDHCFANPGLGARVKACRVDAAAAGSDHKPVWLTIG